MKVKIDNNEINYIRYGNSKGKSMVFLHGWGQNIQMMKFISDYFQDNFDLIVVDLPGHGESSEPESALEVVDFVNIIHKFLEEINVKNPILVGHSFGGKISLLYASMYPTEKLVLFAPSFKVEKTKLTLKQKVLKAAKKIPVLNKLEGFAKKHIGSSDYRNASPVMREILVNSVNTDIREDIKKISASAILIWGSEDNQVDIESARELESIMRDAGLVIYEGYTHYAYLEDKIRTVNIMKSFLEEE